MGRKRKPTVDEVRSIREQMEGHVCDLVLQFEDVTGLTVTGISVKHIRKPGFGAKDTIDINIYTEL